MIGVLSQTQQVLGLSSLARLSLHKGVRTGALQVVRMPHALNTFAWAPEQRLPQGMSKQASTWKGAKTSC